MLIDNENAMTLIRREMEMHAFVMKSSVYMTAWVSTTSLAPGIIVNDNTENQATGIKSDEVVEVWTYANRGVRYEES